MFENHIFEIPDNVGDEEDEVLVESTGTDTFRTGEVSMNNSLRNLF